MGNGEATDNKDIIATIVEGTLQDLGSYEEFDEQIIEELKKQLGKKTKDEKRIIQILRTSQESRVVIADKEKVMVK